MKEFLLIFRNTAPTAKPSPEQIQQVMTAWMDWMANMAAQNQIVDKGNRLSMIEGKTVKPDTVTDGPYTEIKEFINGYTLVRAANLDEAVKIAKGCPILKIGGSVEVRATVAIDDER